jgi:hypothetical protein
MTSKPSPAPRRFHRIDRQRVGQSFGRLLLPYGLDYKGTARMLSRSLSIDSGVAASLLRNQITLGSRHPSRGHF